MAHVNKWYLIVLVTCFRGLLMLFKVNFNFPVSKIRNYGRPDLSFGPRVTCTVLNDGNETFNNKLVDIQLVQ